MTTRYILTDNQQKLHTTLAGAAKFALGKLPTSSNAVTQLSKLKVLRDGKIVSPSRHEEKEFEMMLRHHTEIFDE